MNADMNPFGSKDVIDTGKGRVNIYRISRLEEIGLGNISHFPYSIKILLEALLRHVDGLLVTEEDVESLARWNPKKMPEREIPFIPARVLLQDFTGVPAVVDLAAMRSAVERLGGDPAKINPVIPADLVIDHSIQVDYYGTSYARAYNEKKEFERNHERYTVLRWGQNAFDNFRIIPPGRGIVHQVNLEYLASVVQVKKVNGEPVAFPDTLVGMDSHTTMINSLGVLGWGVGGIEAEAVMLGQPYHMPVPKVVGFRLYGDLKEGVTATDLVLTITQILRKHNVVGKFVEFYGQGLNTLSLPDRATISNMAPEYGATVGFFPIDEETLNYLLMTGRKREHVNLVKLYAMEQGLFRTDESPEPLFSETLELDMSNVEPSLAGPRRPQDRIPLDEMEASFHKAMEETFLRKKTEVEADHEFHRWLGEGGSFRVEHKHIGGEQPSAKYEMKVPVKSGSIVIAAITSCTNTSNPSVIIGAGLLAKNAVERGLKVKPYVKTSLAPGSRVVSEYLANSGLMPYLEALGFHLVGYGCTTCIGNSGPIPENVARAVKENNLIVASVLSGNRNFEGRINPLVKANYLASPPLVVAYAISGTVDIDLKTEPVGYDPNGKPVYLKDIWPDQEEIRQVIKNIIKPMLFEKQYSEISDGTELWENLKVPSGKLYEWDNESTYIQEPPFFRDFPVKLPEKGDLMGLRVLAYLGDSITTDHISPAGEFSQDALAGQYLISCGVAPEDFNSFGSRRGNHDVMMRGTFANINLRNRLVPDKEGGWTLYLPTREKMTIYDAAMLYKKNGIPLAIIAGKEYGTGSSRDWAAKGTCLLGVRAVIAESFERIHRSNLVGMGVLPLQFMKGESADTLGINGDEVLDILGISNIEPGGELRVVARDENGKEKTFNVMARLDSLIEVEFYRNGGILHTFLRNILSNKRS
ncbi:aconitate hydratase AcnA [Candidatus Methanoperedens nitratireducens]|uniref:(2R,3S)-2-methylisocitrate dehydratase n=1 Tax=Candidatus Methanoperedens nitratireducens TaxID=1392998 RepID=A0A284VQF6_9EURY|nr:aconitate hydratase AcnA [Candidatus Methanoperedens nitroreducens]SNQ61407.1 aconitate hydratase 1 [Candidatus Methanoperedens nitroreducens]